MICYDVVASVGLDKFDCPEIWTEISDIQKHMKWEAFTYVPSSVWWLNIETGKADNFLQIVFVLIVILPYISFFAL